MTETLGYGNHLIIDGYGATVEKLEDESLARRLLEEIAETLEPHPRQDPVLWLGDGMSLALALAETQLALHLYPARRALSLDIFSRRDLNTQQVVAALKTGLDMGRYESHLGNRSRTFPKDADTLRQILQGDRNYTEARLDRNLLT